MIAFDEVQPKTGAPTKTFVFLHGILGQGANWRSMARRFVEARPEYRALLVDLRHHGDSLNVEGPHTLEAVANDLATLPHSIDGLLGHSFGGKVALQYAAMHPVEEVWLVDSMPGARPDRRGSETIAEVIEALGQAPREVARRDEFVAALVGNGIPEPIARWLAMSLRREDDVYRFVTDLDAIRAMLDDYFATDLWHVVESTTARTHLIVGRRSDVFGPGDLPRSHDIADSRGNVRVHEVDAGHWVHVEAPDRLAELLAADH